MLITTYFDMYCLVNKVLNVTAYDVIIFAEKENLCLYGLPNETWEVTLPAEEVPPELPEPALGINFARDGMEEKDWLALVAVHSDAWLLAVAFYFGARFGFDKESRFSVLFCIARYWRYVPTVRISVRGPLATGWCRRNRPSTVDFGGRLREKEEQGEEEKGEKREIPNLPRFPVRSVAHGRFFTGRLPSPCVGRRGEKGEGNDVTLFPRARMRRHLQSRPVESQTRASKMHSPKGDEDSGADEEEEEEEDHENTLCGACGDNYANDEFWICCDMCERWFHGKCVRITPARAEHIKQYKCPSCSNKRARV
ncbi:hypothetical protein BHM03_00004833 [Ensete ventricosum]|nr:hypothetical protein BHM03_00004833 [Ensete ventricosum]